MTAVASSDRRGKAIILAIILVSYLMIVLDISIVITGLPSIRQDLGFTQTGLAWVQSAYTLAFGGFLLLGARLGDVLGRRRMFVVGLSIFTLASLAIGLAQSPSWMLVARAIQGIGSAILAPSTLALLQSNFREGPERTRAVAYYGATAGVAASIGLVLGGILADWLSWRVGFFINVPIGVAMILATPRFVRETELSPGRFDLVGAITSTVGMAALVYGTIRSASAGWADAVTIGSLVGGIVLLAVFVLNEWRVEQPIMPLRLFRSPQRSGAFVARILFLGASVGFWFFTTLFMQGVLGFSPALTGIAFLPATVLNFAMAMTIPRLTRRFGNPRLLAFGLTSALLGTAWLAFVSPESSYLGGLAIPMLLIGMGQGGSLSPLTAAAIANVPAEDAGAASGLVNVAHQVGSALGLGILVAASAFGAASLEGTQLLAHRVDVAMGVATVMIALALVVVLAVIVRPWRSKESFRTTTCPA